MASEVVAMVAVGTCVRVTSDEMKLRGDVQKTNGAIAWTDQLKAKLDHLFVVTRVDDDGTAFIAPLHASAKTVEEYEEKNGDFVPISSLSIISDEEALAEAALRRERELAVKQAEAERQAALALEKEKHQEMVDKLKQLKEQGEGYPSSAAAAADLGFVVGASLQFRSETAGGWIDCKVVDVGHGGEVYVDCKPGYAFREKELATQLRHEPWPWAAHEVASFLARRRAVGSAHEVASLPVAPTFDVACEQLTGAPSGASVPTSAPVKELGEQQDTFHVSASTLGGSTVEVSGFNADTSVGELLDKIEIALQIPCGSSSVTATGEPLSRLQASMSVAEAGITAGSVLNVIVRAVKLFKFKHAGRVVHLDCDLSHWEFFDRDYETGRGFRWGRTYRQQPSHLLLRPDGVCRLAFLKTHTVDHAGGPDHYTSSEVCKNMLVGTYSLEDDEAVCTWTKHFELRARLFGPKVAEASARYQRIDLSEYELCDAIDPVLFENDLPLSALGLGLFQTDEMITSLESVW
eukprot:TRINITY_DN16756_c0_g1_i2.p1 TRINITY_DN16756_c0_g1~~TRINITY_DN16756_c0_g1_i2.p1  ORF type:complete len:545 (-),score=65.43 TRINITY_DN16756_c0_g1_i2:86-1645(-)